MFNSPLSDEFDQIMPLGPKVASPGDHMFYIGLFRENIKILSETTRPRALILCM